MKTKPVVGQLVFSLNVGNAARNREKKLTRKIVVSVGRKYFTARCEDDTSGWTDCRFEIETWSEKTNYSADEILYASEQEWNDEKESESILRIVCESFKHGMNTKKVSLDNLRKIAYLIKSEEI
jgi:hypothetical protein